MKTHYMDGTLINGSFTVMILYRREMKLPITWVEKHDCSFRLEGIFTCASAEKGRGPHRTEKPQIRPGLDADDNDDRN